MDEIRALVLKAAIVGKRNRKLLPCAKAFGLSRKCGISLRRLGETCNREGIRIARCQLGCF